MVLNSKWNKSNWLILYFLHSLPDWMLSPWLTDVQSYHYECPVPHPLECSSCPLHWLTSSDINSPGQDKSIILNDPNNSQSPWKGWWWCPGGSHWRRWWWSPRRGQRWTAQWWTQTSHDHRKMCLNILSFQLIIERTTINGSFLLLTRFRENRANEPLEFRNGLW